MRKYFGILLISVLLAALLAACQPAPAATEEATQAPEATEAATEAATEEATAEMTEMATEAATEASAEPVTLQIYLLDYADPTKAWLEDEVKPAFEAEHPGVTVEYIWGSWGTYSETISGFLAAGEGPDIINLGSEHNGLWGSQMAELNDSLGKWDEISNFIPGTLQNASWDGQLRGLPIFSAPRFVFCRTDVMKAAGYDAQPTDFAGWVQFAKDATVIDPSTNAITQQGFVPVDAASMADFQWFLNTYWSIGGELYKDDGTPNFDSEEATAALQFNYDLHRAVYPDDTVGAQTMTGSAIDEPNNAACLWHSGWAAPALDSAIWDKIDIQPFTGDPTNFPNSKPIALAFVDWLAVPAYSPNQDLAVDWLKFAFSKENNNKWNETMGLIPARVDSQYGFVTDNPILAREAEIASEDSYGYAGIVEPTKLQDILQTQLGLYLTDQQDLETTQANIQDQYAEVVANAGQ